MAGRPPRADLPLPPPTPVAELERRAGLSPPRPPPRRAEEIYGPTHVVVAGALGTRVVPTSARVFYECGTQVDLALVRRGSRFVYEGVFVTVIRTVGGSLS